MMKMYIGIRKLLVWKVTYWRPVSSISLLFVLGSVNLLAEMDSPICPILLEIIWIKPFGKAKRMKWTRQSTLQIQKYTDIFLVSHYCCLFIERNSRQTERFLYNGHSLMKKNHVFLLKIFTLASSHSFFSTLLYSY